MNSILLTTFLVASLGQTTGDNVVRVVTHLEKLAERDRGQIAGDALNDFYIRSMAQFCVKEKIPAKDFLVALGIGLDPSDTLRKHPLTREAYKPLHGPKIAKDLGQPTMRKRADWLLHFALSASLTAQINPETAESIGLSKEVADAFGPSGFSFTDLAADEAGIEFARQLLKHPQRLASVADSFRTDAYLPPIADLDEGLSIAAFTKKYGSVESDAFRTVHREIRRRVSGQPAYRE